MSNWFYKATNTKLDHKGTSKLADHGFLCRSAYSKTPAWIANVRKVKFGDVVHFYFIGKKPLPIGAFEIVRSEDFKSKYLEPQATNFDGPVRTSALYKVIDPQFITTLDPGRAYKPDPKLGYLTGWLLRRIEQEVADAPVAFLAGRSTLVPA